MHKFLATGHWENSQWNARVNDVQLKSPQHGNWLLDRDLLISASANKFDVSNSCLVNSSQSICAELQQSEGISNINGNISDISLENLNPLLDNYALKINGVADGDFSFTKNQSNPSATNFDVSAERRRNYLAQF